MGVLKQLLNLISRGMVNRRARETGVGAKARTSIVMSHLGAMLFAQLPHAVGLNDVCDSLRLKATELLRFGITPPARNTLSHANKERKEEFIEKLFWSVLGHLETSRPSYAPGRGKGLLRLFKVKDHAVDSIVIGYLIGEKCGDGRRGGVARTLIGSGRLACRHLRQGHPAKVPPLRSPVTNPGRCGKCGSKPQSLAARRRVASFEEGSRTEAGNDD